MSSKKKVNEALKKGFEKFKTYVSTDPKDKSILWVDMKGTNTETPDSCIIKNENNVGCNCKDWEENIDKLNAGWVLESVHGGTGYAGKFIVFCPWCGLRLKPKTKGKK